MNTDHAAGNDADAHSSLSFSNRNHLCEPDAAWTESKRYLRPAGSAVMDKTAIPSGPPRSSDFIAGLQTDHRDFHPPSFYATRLLGAMPHFSLLPNANRMHSQLTMSRWTQYAASIEGGQSMPHRHEQNILHPRKDADEPVAAQNDHQIALRVQMLASSLYGGTKCIRTIINPASRKVTFSKRRSGLLKKAYELSVLCDAEVGVIIFSPSGRLSEFASSSMAKLLERYEEHNINKHSKEFLLQDVEYWKHEAVFLRDHLIQLANIQRLLLGDDLQSLNHESIQRIEQTIECSLNKIRAQKVKLLSCKIKELQHHESRLREECSELRWKVAKETGRRPIAVVNIDSEFQGPQNESSINMPLSDASCFTGIAEVSLKKQTLSSEALYHCAATRSHQMQEWPVLQLFT